MPKRLILALQSWMPDSRWLSVLPEGSDVEKIRSTNIEILNKFKSPKFKTIAFRPEASMNIKQSRSRKPVE